MITKIIFDTCDCIIEFDENGIWIKTIQTCRLHKNLNGSNLFKTILAHNRGFNYRFGNTPSETEREIMIALKQGEKRRIRNL